MDQKFAMLSSVPESERTPEENSQLEMISAQRISERTASAPAIASNVLQQKTPQQTALETAKTITGNKGKQATTPAALPAGYKQVGTKDGVPVYEGPDGKRYLWGK